jgi:ADP-heptose:LPS heptosyltransferase
VNAQQVAYKASPANGLGGAKFLIIRLSSIGDIVLTSPVVRCLKLQLPDCEIHFLTKKAFAPVVQHNPYINKVFLLENSLDSIIKELKTEGYQIIIDLHNNLRTAKVKRSLGVKSFSLNKLNTQKWLLTALKINRLPKVHIVDRSLYTLLTLNITNDGQGLDYFIAANDDEILNTLPKNFEQGYIGLVIGAALATKKLPLAKLQQLAAGINYPVVLLGGPEDAVDGDAIAAQNPKIYNACGKCSLNKSAAFVKHALLIVTHDTGLMHIAAAFKKPTITIWGNTIPQFGMSAYYGTAAVYNQQFEVNNLSCRPCSKIGHSKCPKGHFKCMELQDIPAIVQTINGYIN